MQDSAQNIRRFRWYVVLKANFQQNLIGSWHLSAIGLSELRYDHACCVRICEEADRSNIAGGSYAGKAEHVVVSHRTGDVCNQGVDDALLGWGCYVLIFVEHGLALRGMCIFNTLQVGH